MSIFVYCELLYAVKFSHIYLLDSRIYWSTCDSHVPKYVTHDLSLIHTKIGHTIHKLWP